jgi:hypothetical protein
MHDEFVSAGGMPYAHIEFQGQDWYLVRRDAGSADPEGEACWHPADDNLRGTAVYGQNDANPGGRLRRGPSVIFPLHSSLYIESL